MRDSRAFWRAPMALSLALSAGVQLARTAVGTMVNEVTSSSVDVRTVILEDFKRLPDAYGPGARRQHPNGCIFESAAVLALNRKREVHLFQCSMIAHDQRRRRREVAQPVAMLRTRRDPARRPTAARAVAPLSMFVPRHGPEAVPAQPGRALNL